MQNVIHKQMAQSQDNTTQKNTEKTTKKVSNVK
jgi:hypothetical protein